MMIPEKTEFYMSWNRRLKMEPEDKTFFQLLEQDPHDLWMIQRIGSGLFKITRGTLKKSGNEN